MSIDALGFVGGVLLVIGFIPQVYIAFKTKKVDDISLLFIIFQMLTCILLITYTTLIGATPLLVANTGILFQLFLLLYAKFKYSGELKLHKLTQTEDIKDILKISYI